MEGRSTKSPTKGHEDRNQNLKMVTWKTTDNSTSEGSSLVSSSNSDSQSDSPSASRSRRHPQMTLSRESMDIDKGFDKDFRSYLTGTSKMDKVLGIWHLLVLITSFWVIVFAFYIRFAFGAYIGYQFNGLPGYATYRQFVKDPNPRLDYHFYSHINGLSNFILVVNVLYIICTVVYIAYFSHRNPMTLPGIALITSIFFLLEGAFANILYNPDVLKDQGAVRRLQARLHDEYTVTGNDEFSVVQNHISIWLQCCGIFDVHDFDNATLSFHGKETLRVPPSCCKRHVFEEGYDAVIACTEKGDGKSTFQRGCMEAYTEWIQTVCDMYVVYIWIHLVDCVAHAWLYKRKIALNNQVISVFYPEHPLNYGDAQDITTPQHHP